MDTFNLYEAKTNLSRLVDRAEAGEEIIIAKAGRPAAKLVPISATAGTRPMGFMRGEIWIGPDFDDPLPADMQAAFDGEMP